MWVFAGGEDLMRGVVKEKSFNTKQRGVLPFSYGYRRLKTLMTLHLGQVGSVYKG
jgi:hypothetical protein